MGINLKNGLFHISWISINVYLAILHTYIKTQIPDVTTEAKIVSVSVDFSPKNFMLCSDRILQASVA